MNKFSFVPGDKAIAFVTRLNGSATPGMWFRVDVDSTDNDGNVTYARNEAGVTFSAGHCDFWPIETRSLFEWSDRLKADVETEKVRVRATLDALEAIGRGIGRPAR